MIIKILFIFLCLICHTDAKSHLEAGIRHTSKHIHIVSDLEHVKNINVYNNNETKLLTFDLIKEDSCTTCECYNSTYKNISWNNMNIEIKIKSAFCDNNTDFTLYDVELDVTGNGTYYYKYNIQLQSDNHVTSESIL